mgnify:CR=1 FL=1
MNNVKSRFGICISHIPKESWFFGICIVHDCLETYLYINLIKWSISIGKILTFD